MRLNNLRRSSNVNDRRGSGVALAGGGGGVFVLALIVYLMGGDPTGLIVNGVSQMSQRSTLSPEQEAKQKDFVAAVLGNTEDVWGEIFRAHGSSYRQPVLTLFAGAVDSACGRAGAAMGPFYCPMDQRVYLDLSFFNDLERRFAAPGDFARAYVIAHEVGHHIQNLEGTFDRVQARQQRSSDSAARALSVRVELQADCYAGVWANRAQAQFGAIEPGDIDEALNAATQIGDDRLQQQSQGHVVPDAFTHGTSEQRSRWFNTGFKAGQIEACDTFGAGKI
ncbi:MAG TPA: neutral zinc metallopeptidase [Patescibacteria group bacterium]|nr:neutral zinc metallopeptidase [Patescibacteria group bacterium]